MLEKEVSPREDLALFWAPQSSTELLHGNALGREVALIFGGTAEGIKAAALQAVHNPKDTAIKLGGSLLVGAGLALAQGRAGFCREAAQVAGLAMGAGFGLDIAGRLGVVAHAVSDTWRSDKNFDQNKAAIGSAVGTFVVDTALMSAGGLAGAKLARVPSVYMGVHEGFDRLRGVSMLSDQAALQTQMLAYHPGTAYHQERVGVMSLGIAKEMRLPPGTVETAYRAGSMHDIGKLKTPLAILDFSGSKLTAYQRVVIDKHATYTGIILKEQVDYPQRLQDIPTVAERHHERLDGQGTPDQLPASQIPLETRINSVADVFDVLSHQRSYKDPTPVDQILDVFKRGRGTQFDPAVVDAFMKQRADRVVGLMLSDGGHILPKSVVAPFKDVSIGELIEAVSGNNLSNSRVTRVIIDRFNNFYGPVGLGAHALPAEAVAHRLSPAHL